MLSSLAIANGAPTLYHLRFVLLNGFVGTWVPRFWETSTFHGPWPCCSYNVTMRHEVAKDSSTQVLGRFRSIKYILKIHHSMCMYCIYIYNITIHIYIYIMTKMACISIYFVFWWNKMKLVLSRLLRMAWTLQVGHGPSSPLWTLRPRNELDQARASRHHLCFRGIF